MTTNFYLSRRLVDSENHGKTYSEAELLTASNYVVVLAEPGGGKTELMRSLARQLGTTAITATKFAYAGTKVNNIPLVIDAFDELSKVDNSGIYKLFSQSQAANPTHVYLSSRSSEWDNAATTAFKDFLGHLPLIVRLCEFDATEQREIFEHHVPGEDFAAFQAEVARFDLEMLLPNPQFLKLFAKAYIESERHFKDKRSIFAQAVEGLAKEANPDVRSINPMLSTAQKVNLSSEVFTKLLLSGAEGICTSEANDSRIYPLLASLFEGDTIANGILATRLFKPGDSVDQHCPVHKIVAEYCAAEYLTKRIANPEDPLTLPKCLSIIAPKSTVRDELRGLLGWMAALGNRPIEETVIELDPYAVLANGDPSRLEHSSKRLLINRLKEIETRDPYFRRGDFWRRFSVVGFFTQDVVDEIKPLLTTGSNGHLRDLLLELLAGSPAIKQLRDELRQLALTPTENDNTRLLANRYLLDIDGDDHRTNLDVLISEASNTSLSIAADTIETLGLKTFDRAYLAKFLRICSKLCEQNDRSLSYYCFLKQFINRLDLVTIECLLDNLTQNLACTCGKKPYECDCRNSISKIVGSILDRYFELATPPFNPIRVWQWVGNLSFDGQKSTGQSKAVEMLQKDNKLRQGIIAYVFGKLIDRDEIFETRFNKFGGPPYSHTGLNFREDDYKFIVDLAFENDNPALWEGFIAGHQYYRNKEERGPNDLRRHMRKQALTKPLFMREWAKTNRTIAQQFAQRKRMWHNRHNRKMNRRLRRQDEIRAANIKYVQDNRELIEGGRHWKCLDHFADLVLNTPDRIEQEFGDEAIVRNALRNCLDFITPHVPDLLELAESQCASKSLYSEPILYAACLEIMRVQGNLEEVDRHLLKALRTNRILYNAVSNDERNALFKEVDRLIFSDSDSVENFLRQYVEPQLAQSGCVYPEICLLNSDNAFSHLRATLSIEWLQRFRELDLRSLDTLFNIAAQYGNRDNLKEIITEYCLDVADFECDLYLLKLAELLNEQYLRLFGFHFVEKVPFYTIIQRLQDIKLKRTFWLVRAWYFLDDTPEEYWDWLKADKETVFILYALSGRMAFDAHSYLPKLTSSKVEAILNAFIEKWPKVNLPRQWGTGSPKEENAYRFLT